MRLRSLAKPVSSIRVGIEEEVEFTYLIVHMSLLEPRRHFCPFKQQEQQLLVLDEYEKFLQTKW